MSKFIDVEAECHDDHCDEMTWATCPNRAINQTGPRTSMPASEREYRRLWKQYGPEGERLCDPERTLVEPWRTLNQILLGTDELVTR